jgi:flavin-binding protein dodecin
MSVVKIIELICEGPTVEEALKNAVTEAAESVQNIKQINVDHVEGIVENNKITKFRVNARISFLIDKSASSKSKK